MIQYFIFICFSVDFNSTHCLNFIENLRKKFNLEFLYYTPCNDPFVVVVWILKKLNLKKCWIFILGCVAGEDCGDYTAAFFTCPVSDDDGEETTTKAPETTKPEETTKPDEETTKPEEETEGPTEGPTEPPTTTAKPFDPDTDCGFENGTGKKEKVQWKG